MKFRISIQVLIFSLFLFLLVRTVSPFVLGWISRPLLGVRKVTLYLHAVWNFPSIYREYESLKKRSLDVDFYRHYVEVLKRENNQLRALLSLPSTKSFKYVFADVFLDPNCKGDFFYIDRGKRDGVRVGFGVMIPGYLVGGRVTEVWEGMAKVILPWHINFSAVGIDETTREEGILQGTGDRIVMRFLSPTSQVEKGDVVRTSQLSMFFPPGLLVGEVERFSCGSAGIECKAEISPCQKDMTFYQVIVLVPEREEVASN